MSYKTASVLIKPQPVYRHHCFVTGLKELGYLVTDRALATPHEGDVLVIWNRHPFQEYLIRPYEKAGCTVLIVENGYVGPTKAIAKYHHNGAGEWPSGDEDRWQKTGIELQPWREDGDFLLLLPQRGMGETGIAMPRNWLANTLAYLRNNSKRPVRVRKHPGQNACTVLEDDLKGAWAAVTWGSGAGIKSIIAGIPVFHGFGKWIGAPAASLNMDIENPFLGDRMPMLRRLAWAQWSLLEIEKGHALAWYLK